MFRLRTDTIQKQREEKPLDKNRQTIGFFLAVRGEGKSNLLETFGEDEFFDGYTILDWHAPPNFENAFWCIPNLDPDGKIRAIDNDEKRDELLKEKYVEFMKDRQWHIKKGNPIAITILGSESLEWNQDGLDAFNGRTYTWDEWIEEGFQPALYPHAKPPLKPKEKWGRELIRFVRLPHATKTESLQNEKVAEVITNEILNARTDRRIVILNRKAFSSEKQYFWTMEVGHRNLWIICDKHFKILTPEMVGKKTFAELSPVEKKWNRLTIMHRELGELAPGGLKADKTGESTPVKKSLLGFGRVCRHWLIDWFADWQKNNDVEGAIRNQADIWYFKKYNRDLGGEEKKGFFDKIKFLRDAILFKGNNSAFAQALADSWFPRVEELAKKYFYAKFLSGNVRVFEVPEMVHQHKEPWMKFEEITGIDVFHDMSKAPKDAGGDASPKAKRSEEMAIYNICWVMKNPKVGKKSTIEDIRLKLVELQKKDEISYPQKFVDMKPETLGKKIQRWAKDFGDPVSDVN